MGAYFAGARHCGPECSGLGKAESLPILSCDLSVNTSLLGFEALYDGLNDFF